MGSGSQLASGWVCLALGQDPVQGTLAPRALQGLLCPLGPGGRASKEGPATTGSHMAPPEG